MRVANIIEEGRYGGPQGRIAMVANELKAFGVSTVVICPKTDSDIFQKKLEQLDIKYIKAPLRRITKQKTEAFKYIITFFYEIFWLYNYFHKQKFDLIHCSGGSWQYKGVIAGSLTNTKIVWHLNDTNMPVILQKMFRLLALCCANGLIVAGQRVLDYYSKQKINNIPIFEIQAPVNTVEYDERIVEPDEKLAQVRGFKIVTVGALNPAKGCEYFIAMAKILSERYDNIHFFIIGPEYQSQKKYIDKLYETHEGLSNLHFYGPSNNIKSVLKAADIYVCSSITEASPIAVWEAMSMNKAIVATDVGDVPRYVIDGISGFVVPPADPEALAEKVAILIEHPELRENFGSAARVIAIQNLDVKVITQKHFECYRIILSK